MGNHDAVWVFGAPLGWTSCLLHTGGPVTQSWTELIKSGLRPSSQGQPALERWWVCWPKFQSLQVRKGTPAPTWGKSHVMRRRGRGPPITAPITLTSGRTCSSGLADPAGTHSLATVSGAPQGEVPASPSPHNCPGLSLPTPVFQVFKQKPGRLSPQKPH